MTFTTVVNVKIPINLFIFLRFFVYFAMMDVLQGRYLYKKELKDQYGDEDAEEEGETEQESMTDNKSYKDNSPTFDPRIAIGMKC